MQIISDLRNFQPDWPGSVVTLGDFDGIHAGHRDLIEKICDRARERDLAPIFLTYDPSPKTVLQKRRFDSQIFTRDEKISVLQQYQLRAAVFLKFDVEMAALSAKSFLQRYLLEKLRMRHLVIGYDHRFGKNRRGTFSYLESAAGKYRFTVEKAEKKIIEGQTVSSTYVRALLKEGNVEKAKTYLSRPYFIDGVVIAGRQRGTQLGIPTANLHIPPEKLVPKEGVYAARVRMGGVEKQAVVNIGFNPTFENTDLSVEVHILDFQGNLYGTHIRTEFMHRIRNEQKFSGIDELVMQIKADIEKAKRLLSAKQF